MAKVKIATTWLDCCSGCHMSFLDIDEAIIEVAELVEFTRSPITDIKEFTPVDVGIVEGAVSTTKDEEVIIFWTKEHYKRGVFFSAFMPRLWVMVCPKGAFELMTNNTCKPELTGEARWNAKKPIIEWKPEVME